MTARRSLVTGAAGFVGANLVRRLLEKGDDVRAVERPGGDGWRLDGVDAERISVDLRDGDAAATLLRRAKPDRIFHLAAHGAYSWQTDTNAILAMNVVATVALLQACLETDCEAFIHAGSSSEYGFKDHAPAETEAPEPNSDYAAAKAAATLYVGHLGRRSGRRVATLRLYSVYGPWEDPRRLVPTLIRHALCGEWPPLADPHVARDFVYVDDTVDAFVAAADHGSPGAVYNIGTGRQLTLREVVEVVRLELGVEAEPVWGTMQNRSWDTTTWLAAPGRAQRELNWHPRFSFESGLRATVEWAQAVRAV